MSDDTNTFSKKMPEITDKRIVTPGLCKKMLEQAGWQDRTIELLFRGDQPEEVQVGNMLLIVR